MTASPRSARPAPLPGVTASLVALALSAALTSCTGTEEPGESAATTVPQINTAAGTDKNGVPLTDATGAPVQSGDVEPGKAGLIGEGCKGLTKITDPKTPVLDLLTQTEEFAPFAAWLSGETVPGIDKTSRIEALAAKNDVTLVVPSAAAIEAIPDEAIDNFVENTELFSDILSYHVVTKRIEPSDLANGPMPTLHGADLVSVQSQEGPGLDTATIVCGGIEADGAVIYVVNSVILPPAS